MATKYSAYYKETGQRCPKRERESSLVYTYSVNVRDGRRREIVIYNEIYAFKVYTSAHQFCTDQDPNLSFSKATHDIVSLEKYNMINVFLQLQFYEHNYARECFLSC